MFVGGQYTAMDMVPTNLTISPIRGGISMSTVLREDQQERRVCRKQTLDLLCGGASVINHQLAKRLVQAEESSLAAGSINCHAKGGYLRWVCI